MHNDASCTGNDYTSRHVTSTRRTPDLDLGSGSIDQGSLGWDAIIKRRAARPTSTLDHSHLCSHAVFNEFHDDPSSMALSTAPFLFTDDGKRYHCTIFVLSRLIHTMKFQLLMMASLLASGWIEPEDCWCCHRCSQYYLTSSSWELYKVLVKLRLNFILLKHN